MTGDPLDLFVRDHERLNVLPKITASGDTLDVVANFRAFGRFVGELSILGAYKYPASCWCLLQLNF